MQSLPLRGWILRKFFSTLLKPGKQLREGNLKRARDLREIVKTQIGFAAFDGSHECAVDATEIGKFLLRITPLSSKLTNA